MNTLMKKFYSLCLGLLAFCSSAWAGTPGVTFVLTNGEKVSFSFDELEEIVVTIDGLSLTDKEQEELYAILFDNIDMFYYEEDIDATGISQVAAGSVSTQQPVVHYADGVVSVSGMAAGSSLVVSSVGGSRVGGAKADGAGTASVDLGGQPAGVYVVSTGSGVSFKLMKK